MRVRGKDTHTRSKSQVCSVAIWLMGEILYLGASVTKREHECTHTYPHTIRKGIHRPRDRERGEEATRAAGDSFAPLKRNLRW